MKNLVLVILTAAISIFGYRYYVENYGDPFVMESESALIQEKLQNVSKIVVTEGHFSEVKNIKESKDLLGSYFNPSWLRTHRNVLLVVNTDASISYDLSLLEYELDDATKTLRILSIPEPEIKVNPQMKYLEMNEGFFYSFEEEDLNKIRERVENDMREKVEASTMRSNAQNRLMSELAKFFVLTNSQGWKLEYQGELVKPLEIFSESIEGAPVEG